MIVYNVMYKNRVIAVLIDRMDAENFMEEKIQFEFRTKWEARKEVLLLYSKNSMCLPEEQELYERARLYEQLRADFSIDTRLIFG